MKNAEVMSLLRRGLETALALFAMPLRESDVLEHKHLIMRGRMTAAPADEEDVRSLINDIADSLGMSILVGPQAVYSEAPGNEGYSGFAIITTSHIAYHDWEDTDGDGVTFQLDVYTCSPLNLSAIMGVLRPCEVHSFSFKIFDREYGIEQIGGGHG